MISTKTVVICLLTRLSECKQSKVYLPEEPFPHAHLVKTGRLKHFKSIHDDAFNAEFRQPCIVFCGHPSLRFGDSVHFVQLWGSNPLHTIIFTGTSNGVMKFQHQILMSEKKIHMFACISSGAAQLRVMIVNSQ